MFIVIAQRKGGVRKTTTATNVAALLARRGARVLVDDADPHFASPANWGSTVATWT